MNWYAVELHTHTRHSDGQMTVPELVRRSEENRLALIALTDHNTQSGLIEAGEGVIPGIEWTTHRGHMTVLGASRYVDWRDIDPENLDGKLWDIQRAGGLNCVAHPFRIGSPICTGCHFDYRIRDSGLIDLWEVWSGGAPPLKRDNALSFRAFRPRWTPPSRKQTPTARSCSKPVPPSPPVHAAAIHVDVGMKGCHSETAKPASNFYL